MSSQFATTTDAFVVCILMDPDVSGKSIPVVMFMTLTRNLFRTIAPYTCSTAKVLWHINQTLADLNDFNKFITFFVGILLKRNGKLVYANA